MALRNVPITPGDGDNVRFDGGNQIVKTAYGAEGVETLMAEKPATEAKQDAIIAAVAAGAPMQGGAVAYQPGYDRMDQGGGPANVDPAGNLAARAQVLTDEGTFRCNFANSSLAVALGTVTLTNGSRAIAWSITDTTDVHAGDYIKLNADAESAWAQIESIDSLAGGTLVANYTGTGGTGAGSRSLLRPSTGTGASITVASGQATIACGTTATAVTRLRRFADYAPLVIRQRLSISQRIANQTIYIGCGEDVAAPRWFARFAADGATDTTIRCETGRNPTGAPSASEQEQTTVTLPNGATTATMREYRIELLTEVVRFYIDGVLVAQHTRVIPAQHDEMTAGVSVENGTTPATNTNVLIDYLTTKNHNKIEVGIMSDTEQVVIRCRPGDYLNPADVVANNTDVAVFDCSQVRQISALFTAPVAWSGVTVSFQQSNDGSTWSAITGWRTDSLATASSTTTAGQTFIVPTLGARYVRFRVTGRTSGTIRGFFMAQECIQGALVHAAIIGTPSVNIASNQNITPVPQTGQGSSTSHRTAFVANITTGAPTLIKNGAGVLNSLRVANNSGTGVWFHLYNLGAAPTMGTSTPELSVWVPAGGSYVHNCGPFGERYATGMSYAITDNCAAIPTAGGTITIASTTAAICVSARYT